MSTHSLGIVFGPTLLRAENETGNMAVHMVYQNQIAELMLSAYDQIFSWLTDEASYWVCSHLSRCLIFLHFCKHISEIFFSFQATDASFCENLMMILCLSSKHLNKIVDNICLYVFYINPFTANAFQHFQAYIMDARRCKIVCRGHSISKNSLNETLGHCTCACVCADMRVSVNVTESTGMCPHRWTSSLPWLPQACVQTPLGTQAELKEGARHKWIIFK